MPKMLNSFEEKEPPRLKPRAPTFTFNTTLSYRVLFLHGDDFASTLN
jgi:hypothetical protein